MRLSRKQLELIYNRKLGHAKGERYSNGRKLYYAAKQKLRELMLQRFAGTDENFSWKRGDKEYVLFSSPQKEEKDGWVVDGMWAMLSDLNEITLIEGLSTEHVISCLMEFTGICDMGMHCTVPGREEMETRLYYEKVLAQVSQFLGDYYGCEYELEYEPGDEFSEEEQEQDKSIMNELAVDDAHEIAGLIMAVDKAADGFIEEALDNYEFNELITSINSNMGDIYDKPYIVMNLCLFLAPYIWSSSENQVSIDTIMSEEIYWYNRYKDNVPSDVRETVDVAIGIFDKPIPWLDAEVEDFDRNHQHIVTLLYQDDWDITLQDVNPMWKDVKDFLAETLPGLRKQYMVSDSQLESRTLLFLCGF